MNPIIAMTLGYVGVVLLALLVINFLTAGFLRIFMQVKGSRGKKIMTNIVAVNRNYLKAGYVENGWYVYTDGNGFQKRLSIPKKNPVFYRQLNLSWCNVDEEKNVFITSDGKEISGFDAIRFNNLYLRALESGRFDDPKQKLIFFLIIATALMSLITLGILAFVILKKLGVMQTDIAVIKSAFIGLNNTI